jgi:hypothetical protein
MAIILPTGWNRQPTNRTALDPKWVAAGLNLALIPHGNGFIDCSARNTQGTGGVRTAGTCPQGNTVLRTSGNYSFRGLNQNVTTFSRIIVARQVGTGESVFSVSTNSSTNNSAQVNAQNGQIQLIAADQALVATSTNAALANGKTSIIGVTYNHAATQVKFYCDGRILNTVTASATFAVDGVGTLFVKPNGGNPFAGGMALHLDFNRILTDAQMVALTTNPWQVFAPRQPLYAVHTASGPVTHTGSGDLIGGGAAIDGAGNSFTIHTGSGDLAGGGAVIDGTGNNFTVHSGSGDLVADGAIITGSGDNYTVHSGSGDLVAGGAVITGTGEVIVDNTHVGQGDLVGGGAVVTGTGTRIAAAVTHTGSGVLVGGGAIVTGSGINNSVTPPTPVQPSHGGGGITQYVETKFKPKKSVRKLIEAAYTEPTVSKKEQQQVIIEVAQEIQAIPLAEIDVNLIIELIQMYEARLLKQRNDELAAIILLLD